MKSEYTSPNIEISFTELVKPICASVGFSNENPTNSFGGSDIPEVGDEVMNTSDININWFE